ncbi:MAG TPA: class I SAM-dependent methyltransferase [Acidimicrobiales bacterium]|nr:class I SAM-dependent methyltransferase [Acidimicrobiales bacterium]
MTASSPAGGLRFLDPVVAADPPRPPTDPAAAEHPMRKVTRQVAFDPDGWTAERRAKVAELFDGLAPSWHEHRHDPQRTAPLEDAYARGDIPAGGACLEVGSGDGQNTAFLAAHHDLVVAADLSLAMLRHAPVDIGHRVRTDSSASPLRDGAVDVVVLVNALLFPREMARVLGDGGALVWVNTAGDRTPIHLSAEEVVDALPGDWQGVVADAGQGTWAVLHRA